MFASVDTHKDIVAVAVIETPEERVVRQLEPRSPWPARSGRIIRAMLGDHPQHPLFHRGIDLLRHAAHPPKLRTMRDQTWALHTMSHETFAHSTPRL
jgi:hypothetical protein